MNTIAQLMGTRFIGSTFRTSGLSKQKHSTTPASRRRSLVQEAKVQQNAPGLAVNQNQPSQGPPCP